ncbi:MAG: MarC family protein [Candidatus Omnitrophota bacterium]
MWRQFALSFIPLFVAVDALGNLPFFLSLTSGMIRKQRRAVVNESVSVACFLAILFMLAGKWVLKVLGISVADFKIAGGILLLTISVSLLLPGKSKFASLPGGQENVGVFPLATPLITGPAVLTITLILLDKFGFLMTFISIVLNMLIVWIVFASSQGIFRLLGQAGSRAFSKISEILLAAIAIMLIRQGITEAFILMR